MFFRIRNPTRNRARRLYLGLALVSAPVVMQGGTIVGFDSLDPVTGGAHTYHTTNPVPFLLIDDSGKQLREGGSLQDIAPTILGALGVEQPKEMKGRDLRY